MRVIFGEWTCSDVAVLEISDHEWRVTDLRRREPDGMPVLGLVEHKADRFEVTTAPPACACCQFEAFEEAVSYLTEMAGQSS